MSDKIVSITGFFHAKTQRGKVDSTSGTLFAPFAPLREISFYFLLIVVHCAWSLSLPAALRASNTEVVVIQRRIKYQEELALCLMSPHRIRSKHHHVTAPNRHIDNRRPVRKFIGACQHTAD